ncbi:MAG: YwaF family protein [Clostridia bacterium]|nr:YwaF family protein [Clostridia bacterium]
MNFWEQVFGWHLDSNETEYFKFNHIFSVWHFVALALIVTGIVLLCVVARKKDKSWQGKMFKIIAIVLLVLEILRMTYRTITYCCYETYLPDNPNIYNWAEIISFALCTMITFFTIVTLLINKEKWNAFAYDAIFAIALFGGSTALIYPDMLNTYYPIYHIMNVQTLITHGLLVAVPILLVVTGRLKPRIKNWWKPMLLMFGFSIIARIFSKLADCSFMYMNDGIELIPSWSNKPLYSYYWILALVFAAWIMLCYLPFEIVSKHRKSKEKKEEQNINQKSDELKGN